MDHLRVCGADFPLLPYVVMVEGSPPRVRSRRQRTAGHGSARGITSACAEQTPPWREPTSRPGDHLRVCGADISARAVHEGDEGSPPRVRSRRCWGVRPGFRRGITSACAEQTGRRHRCYSAGRDHLRVCGADAHAGRGGTAHHGSPPRVRSRPASKNAQKTEAGITSACAEQTPAYRLRASVHADHLRVCGADIVRLIDHDVREGSPPRVRSRRLPRQWRFRGVRITSACAEQTLIDTLHRVISGDHLRVCGADLFFYTISL